MRKRVEVEGQWADQAQEPVDLHHHDEVDLRLLAQVDHKAEVWVWEWADQAQEPVDPHHHHDPEAHLLQGHLVQMEALLLGTEVPWETGVLLFLLVLVLPAPAPAVLSLLVRRVRLQDLVERPEALLLHLVVEALLPRVGPVPHRQVEHHRQLVVEVDLEAEVEEEHLHHLLEPVELSGNLASTTILLTCTSLLGSIFSLSLSFRAFFFLLSSFPPLP